MRFLYKFFFQTVAGWKIVGDVPRHLKKYIIVVAPHTSNWDFLIGISLRSIMRFPSNFLAKKELFQPPFGWFFKALGGYPVDRDKSSNIVEQIVTLIKTKEQFVVAIAPEGTRKTVQKWKTGFYYIAHKTKIPIVLVSLDYVNKIVTWNTEFYVSGDLESDAILIDHFFKGKKGKLRFPAPVLG
jgi:1-acyl-sn-glycerol-3-phosphate acyltransferase